MTLLQNSPPISKSWIRPCTGPRWLRPSYNPVELSRMVGEMVQNSQSLYAFAFNVLIDIHEYIYSHSTTEFTF